MPSAISVGGRHLALPAATVRRIVKRVLEDEGQTAAISVTFLGLESMRRMNRRYQDHDRPTDVLAFPLAGSQGSVMGDIYVCRAVAQHQARHHAVTLREELIRLVVHGVLHVLGYQHPDGDGRERSPMWRRQEKYIKKVLSAEY